jgi:hypothetical protein
MAEVAKNTAEQIAALEAQEAQAAEEAKWPLWEVVLSGDETEHVARAGGPTDKKGNPISYMATAMAQVFTKARSRDEAVARAMNANPGMHTVESAKEKKST